MSTYIHSLAVLNKSFSEQKEIVRWLRKAAEEHKIWVFAGEDSSEQAKKIFKDFDSQSGYLIFDISESSQYNNCDKLFEEISLFPHIPAVDISQSFLPEIGTFFEKMLGYAGVREIRVIIGDSHYPPLPQKVIHVKDFCSALEENMRAAMSFNPYVNLVLQK